MPYLTRKLITRAYWLSQIVSRGLETVTGDQMSEGLDLLNLLLDVKGSDTRLIPYFTRYQFPLVAGQEEYFIENLFDIQTLTFNYGNVRYGMTSQTRAKYFGNSRVNNITSLPFTYRAERELHGMRIWVYFLPNDDYTVDLTGKFALANVTLDEDLTLTYDTYYLEYLRYALAQYLCSEYAIDMQPESLAKFEEIRKKLMDVSPPDMSGRKINFSGGNNAINWGLINLSNGYLPPGGGGY
ncbi:hypothetical protein UFOVP855_2 [uncultured Caudovirales phage]|jgi:hypothetical protein|uniref:Uncharacterized protein n=1 Tax=uncultured Caudovirales phage TaxID=2100421 RepID=A0A6J5Q9Y9_9CAUD|nr:hypothetical protein UFOVP527_32 [uncultured Caudovirales phage]CAB4167130.1 hypothetical protein UFOVP855_2 [uncultured Caudovirales phage]CAB4173576.1 hypothetical protein UFOVP954_19 [uncultured Caudovirales phage]CAB4179217.1 hypothetical protein UFOVP1026_42 [uncultured Caudovirales phage]CAB4188474.1 hypothetical protein UFOVP1180_26 [uncultured Caudovirales phage]